MNEQRSPSTSRYLLSIGAIIREVSQQLPCRNFCPTSLSSISSVFCQPRPCSYGGIDEIPNADDFERAGIAANGPILALRSHERTLEKECCLGDRLLFKDPTFSKHKVSDLLKKISTKCVITHIYK